MKLVAIILAFNEARHLPRCLTSLEGVVDSVLVVDCFSTDDTVAIAEAHGATVVQHKWVNYATQFNWALDQLDEDSDWVLRIDTDEYLTPQLATEIRERLSTLDPEVDGPSGPKSCRPSARCTRRAWTSPWHASPCTSAPPAGGPR